QDFALIRTGEVNAVTDGTALEAYYPALFNTAKPLAYTEWFTPFTCPEPESNLYVLWRSTRRHLPYAEIVDLDRIARNCFLVP
ncbi:hypothetical protein B0H19DRAFT_896455, partial [Mycena capillaripes]